MAEGISARMQWKVMPHSEAYSLLYLENIFDGPRCWLHIPKAIRVIKDQAVADMSGVAGIDGSFVKDASMQDCPPNLDKLAEVIRNDFFYSREYRVTFGYIAGISVDRGRHKSIE